VAEKQRNSVQIHLSRTEGRFFRCPKMASIDASPADTAKTEEKKNAHC
jgi:hypothetical protein